MTPTEMANQQPELSSLSMRVPGRALGWKTVLAALWLLALVPRLALALLFLHEPIALDDMYQYDMLARSINSGNGYRWYARADVEKLAGYLGQFVNLSELTLPENGLETTFRAPGYPAFLSVVYRIGTAENRFAIARVTQAMLSACMAPFVAILALKLGMRSSLARAAGLAMAFYPILCFYPLGLASENTFLPLVLLSVILILHAAKSGKASHIAIAGIVSGGAMLTRSIIAPFYLLAGIWFWRYSRRSIAHSILFLAISFGICVPWSIRNTRFMGSPTFVETSMGYNLFVGSHPDGTGAFVTDVAIIPLTILDDAERNEFSVSSAITFIREDPLEALWRVVRRSAFFLGVEDRELTYFYTNNFLGSIAQPWLLFGYLLIVSPWVIILTFATLAIIHRWNKSSTVLVVMLIAGYTLPHLLILAEPRFHLALVPLLLPYAVQGLLRVRTFQADSREKWIMRASISVLALFWIWGLAMNLGKLIDAMGPGGNLLFLPY
jgi:hypothetical protein